MTSADRLLISLTWKDWKREKDFAEVEEALQNEDSLIRALAVIISAESRNVRSIPFLRKALISQDPFVRRIAFTALIASEEPKDQTSLINYWSQQSEKERHTIYQQLKKALDTNAPKSIRPLLRVILNDNDISMRLYAALLLQYLKDNSGKELLKEVISNDQMTTELRMQALFGLYYAEDEAVIPLMITATRDSDPTIRAKALFLLGKRMNTAHMALFKEALKDTDKEVRRTAFAALRNYGGNGGVNALHEMMNNVNDVSLQVDMAEFILKKGDVSVLQKLVELLMVS